MSQKILTRIQTKRLEAVVKEEGTDNNSNNGLSTQTYPLIRDNTDIRIYAIHLVKKKHKKLWTR